MGNLKAHARLTPDGQCLLDRFQQMFLLARLLAARLSPGTYETRSLIVLIATYPRA